MQPRTIALALTALAACAVPEELSAAEHGLEFPDAPPPVPNVESVLVAVGATVRSGARIGEGLVVTSSRVVTSGTAASTVSLASTATGWYANGHPSEPVAVVQVRPDTPLPVGIPVLALDTQANVGDPAGCSSPAFTDQWVVVTSVTSRRIVVAGAFTAADIGAPCARFPGVLLGIIDSVTATSATLVHAGAFRAWLPGLEMLEDTRLAADATPAVVGGPYTLSVAAGAQEMCLDLLGGTVDSHGAINQWPCHRGKNEQFFLDGRVDAAHPRLVSNQSGLCIDVPGGAQLGNVALQQFPCHTGANQCFTREKTPLIAIPPRRRYRPTSWAPGCMAAQSGAQATGGGLPVRQMACSSPMQAHELWAITPVPPS